MANSVEKNMGTQRDCLECMEPISGIGDAPNFCSPECEEAWIADLKPTEIPCARCRGPVVEFTIPNEVWNAVIRPDGHERDDEYLCLACWHAAIGSSLKLANERAERFEAALAPFAKLAEWPDKLRHEDESTDLHRIKAKDLRVARAALAGLPVVKPC